MSALLLEQDPLDPDLELKVHYVRVIFCSISVLSLCLLFLVLVCLKAYKKIFERMIMVSALGALIYSIPLDSILASDPTSCEIVGFFNEIGFILSGLWSTYYAHLLMVVISQKPYNLRKLLIIYTITSVVAALIFSVLSLQMHYVVYEEVSGVCLHTGLTGAIDWSFILTKILPIFVVIILSLTYYGIVIKELRILSASQRDVLTGSYAIILLLPAGFLLLWIPVVVCNILNVAWKIDIDYYTYAVIFLLTKLHGLVMATVFFICGRIRSGILKLIRREDRLPITDSTIEWDKHPKAKITNDLPTSSSVSLQKYDRMITT